MRVMAWLFTLITDTHTSWPEASASATASSASSATTASAVRLRLVRVSLLFFRLHLLLDPLGSFQDVLIDLHASFDPVHELIASRPANLYHIKLVRHSLDKEIDVGARLDERLAALQEHLHELVEVGFLGLVLHDVVDHVLDPRLRGKGRFVEPAHDPVQDVAHGGECVAHPNDGHVRLDLVELVHVPVRVGLGSDDIWNEQENGALAH